MSKMTISAIAPSMATSPRLCLEGSGLAMSAPLYAHRKQFCSVAFQGDLREGSRRRALQNRTIFHRKEPLMARAFEAVIFRRVVDSTRQVRALLAVGHVFFFAGPNHDAMVLRSRVRKQSHAANRDFAYVGDFNRGKPGSLSKTRFR